MRIALVSQNVSPGITTFRKELILELIERGHEVYALASDYSETSRQQVKAFGAIPISYPMDRAGLNPIKDFINWLALCRTLKQIKPMVVLSFFMKPSIYGTLAAKVVGVERRFAMVEGLGYAFTKEKRGFTLKKKLIQKVLGLLSTVSFFFADKVFFLNRDDSRDLRQVSLFSENKVITLGGIGVDLCKFRYEPLKTRSRLRFIFIARLLKEKGIYEFINAVRMVKETYPDTEFVVLGGLDSENPSGITQSELDNFIDEGLISSPGFVTDVEKWISDSDVFVLPSYREGIPRSTQEAMAMGKAIITTDTPGCRETVIEGVNGLLVPPFDASKLAESMIYLINNKDVVLKMGEASRVFAEEHFDVKKINKKLIDILLANS